MNARAEFNEDDDDGDLTHDMEGGAPDLELESLSGDMRDEMLTRIKHLKATWGLLSQNEQMDVANGLELFAKNMVRRAVHLVTRQKFPHTAVQLAEMKIGGTKGIEAKIICDNIQHNREVLGEHIGQFVQMVMIDSDTFMGERAAVQIDPDQPGLNLDGDGDKDPADSDQRLLPPPANGKPQDGDLE